MKSKEIVISENIVYFYNILTIFLICLTILLLLINRLEIFDEIVGITDFLVNKFPLIMLLSILIGFLIINSRIMFPTYNNESWKWFLGIILMVIPIFIMTLFLLENHTIHGLLILNFQSSFFSLIIGGSLIITASINTFIVFILDSLEIKIQYR